MLKIEVAKKELYQKKITGLLGLVLLGMLTASACATSLTTSPAKSEATRAINENAQQTTCQAVSPNQFYRHVLDQYREQHLLCKLKGLVKDGSSQSTTVVLRALEARFAGRQPSEHFVLVANPKSLETSILPADCVADCVEFKPEDHSATLPYARALTAGEKFSGAQHEENSHSEVYLTADLCPSKKELDREFFSKLDAGTLHATPIALSVAGGWLRHHQSELEEIKKLAREGHFRITWINHSYSHPYNKDLPLEHNFLLESGINLSHEVFDNERLMIFNGLLPSVFFRFPGLVSDSADALKLKTWGLIPVSADAWLAKGQKIKVGSIILVHANGNEPLGLNLLYKNLEEWPALRSLFGDLNDAFTF